MTEQQLLEFSIRFPPLAINGVAAICDEVTRRLAAKTATDLIISRLVAPSLSDEGLTL